MLNDSGDDTILESEGKARSRGTKREIADSPE